LVTADFIHFEDWGEALPRGAEGAQDVWVFTGSAIAAPQGFHIYYTGHNSHFENTDRPVQMVMRAASPDLRTWTKDPDFRFVAPLADYEKDDWRDPFVFWNEEAGEYWMLLAARRRAERYPAAAPRRQRGCTALATSPDLQTWTVREPFWAPDEYYTHECPDLFRIGEWWYLVYSTFSERCVTHYRLSRSLAGPWIAPGNDTFDGRPYYAAKTAGDGARRYAFGWLATREGETDEGRWQWGGNLVVHEIEQQPDGALTVRPPKTILAAFAHSLPLAPRPLLGDWRAYGDGWAAQAVGRASAIRLTDAPLPDECLVEATVAYEPGTASCGLLLRLDDALDAYYQLRLEPAAQRMTLDRWPRPGDQPFMMERPLSMQPGAPVRLRAFLDGTCLVVYANDQAALSCRLYDHHVGALGAFVTEGAAQFRAVSVKER